MPSQGMQGVAGFESLSYVPIAHGVQEPELPAGVYSPAVQLMHGFSGFDAPTVPAGHVMQTRSDVAVGAISVCPLMQAGDKFSHTRSELGVGGADWNCEDVQVVTFRQSVFCCSEQKPPVKTRPPVVLHVEHGLHVESTTF